MDLDDINTEIINFSNFSKFEYSKKEHFEYFRKIKADWVLYNRNLTPEDSDLKNYQNMLVYSFVKRNIEPGCKLIEIGNSNSPVTRILNNEGYICWKLGFSFVLPENGKIEDIKVEWIIKNEKGKIVNYIPKDLFDFGYSVSAFVNIPEYPECFNLMLEKVKSLIKPQKYSLFCFLNIVNIDKHIWYNKFLDYIYENVFTLNKRIPHHSLLNDNDIFIMSEQHFNKFYKKSDEMTYENIGKLFSYSVLWQNNYILQAEGFHEFTFSKNSHFGIFNHADYSQKLYGKNIPEKEKTIRKYQHLLFFTFLKANLTAGSKILILGDCDKEVTEQIKGEYVFFFLTDSGFLSNQIFSSASENIIPIVDSDGKRMEKMPFKFFDLIFSFNGFVFSGYNLRKFRNIDSNLYYLSAPFGLSLFSFICIIINRELTKPEFIRYLLSSKEILNRIELNIETEKDLFIEKSSNLHYYDKNLKNDNENICFNMLWTYKPKLPVITESKPSDSLKSRPAYFFHHIMKCGGTSVVYVLHNWFNLIFDHYEKEAGIYDDLDDFHRYKLNLDNIVSDTCIIAHFQLAGGNLTQRYSEVIHKPSEFRAFTFVRDPMELLISLYYYNRKTIKSTLQKFLNAQSDFLANLIQCNDNNYQEVINRYFFIGIVEKMQESFDKLADLTGKQRQTLPFVNKSEKDDQISELSPEFIKKFKNNNKLDYLIYNYCMEKFNKY